MCGVLLLIYLVLGLGIGLGLGLPPPSTPATVLATVTLPATQLSTSLATAVRCDVHSALGTLATGPSAVALTSYLPVGAPAIALLQTEAANTAACSGAVAVLQVACSSVTVQGLLAVNVTISAAGASQAAAMAARVSSMAFASVLQVVGADPCLLPSGVTLQAFNASLRVAVSVK